ncbi:MAG: FAD-binding oxidoreductase [Candidatus Fermentibacteraceae bacterium]|nr:FAD-binding oxidoreductase [Candidatus Fermentibacteraceae bacterium]
MRSITGRKNIEDFCADVLTDESNLAGAWCDKAAWPETKEEVQEFVRNSAKEGVPITVSGGLTGIAGGALPEGGAVVSTSCMKKIEHEDNGLIIAEAGVTFEELQRFISSTAGQFFYPPDPTEETASIGGTIATDASGADSFLYGSTREWIQKLELVLPSGKLLEIERDQYRFEDLMCMHPDIGTLILPKLSRKQPPKNAAGYYMHPDMDLIDLFIGSESTLGLITRAWLRLAPVPPFLFDLTVFPEDFISFWNLFENLLNTDDSLRIRAIEMMDDRCIDFIRSHPGDFPPPPENAHCALLLRAEACNDDQLDEALTAMDETLEKSNVSSETAWGGFEPSEQQKIRDFRHALPESVNHLISEARRECPSIHKLGSDGAVEPSKLREYYFRTREILEERNLPFVIFGHAGQGHIHANALPHNLKELVLAEEAMYEIAAAAVEMGGTVSAEHGLGKLKIDFLRLMYTDREIEGMETIRRIIDPDRLFSRSLKFPGWI